MAWVLFTRDYDWPKLAPSHTAYKAGMRCNVPHDCAAEAIDDQAAQPAPPEHQAKGRRRA